MRPARGQQQGFALAAAVLALVVVGAIVTGGFYAASQEGRIGATTRYSGEAFYIAERGLHSIVGVWTKPRYDSITVGSSRNETGSVTVGGRTLGTYSVAVRRMAQRVFFVSSTGRVTYGGRYAGASRAVGMVVRTLSMGLQTDRAVQIYGGLEVGGNATVTGEDGYPSNWANCPPASGDQKAVVAKDTSLVYTRGGGQIVGSPAEVQDTSLNAQDFLQYGDVSFEELKALAEKVYPAGVTVNNTAPALTEDGRCDKSVQSNWGAPTDATSPCHFYFPIIYAQGNLTISSSSSGQGILLVEGDLKIAGGFQFNGLIIVKGTLETGSGNAQINGSVMVYSGGSLGISTVSDLTGTPIVSLGTCSIKRAEEYNTAVSRAIPLSTRAWIDLSGAGTSSN